MAQPTRLSKKERNPMTKPTGTNRNKLQCIRQKAPQAATAPKKRGDDQLLKLTPEMIDALWDMLEALPGGRRASMHGCNQ
jgi:hypothetical protein